MKWTIFPLLLLLPAAAVAHASGAEEPPLPGSRLLGQAAAIPLGDESGSGTESFLPELTGLELASGSQLVDGQLPRPYLDYSCEVAGVRERLTIFENGLVALDVRGVGATIRKRVIMPADAFARYREVLHIDRLAEIDDRTTSGFGRDRARIRITAEGRVEERRFAPGLVLSHDLEKMRLVLQDIIRALSFDRGVTNPVSRYVPQLGDRLISDDRKMYEVTKITDDGAVLELTSATEPVRIYVATKELHQYFVTTLRREQR